MTSTEIKNNIAACEIMIASRYHSCVAALSSGVPLLVIGWHYKYKELLHLYGQDDWILSETECSSRKLINSFDSLWEKKETVKYEIIKNFEKVRSLIVNIGKKIYYIEK